MALFVRVNIILSLNQPARGLPNHILVMVQQGATSPISYAGSVAVHNADFLAFNTLLQCVNRGNPTLYGASACVMDMKKGLSLVAAPEVFVLNAAMARVIGAMRPILMGAAKANELHNIAVATAATIPIRFFMLSSLEEM